LITKYSSCGKEEYEAEWLGSKGKSFVAL